MNERSINATATEVLWKGRNVPDGYYGSLEGKTTEEILAMAGVVAIFLDDSFDGIIVWTGDKEQDDTL